MNDSAKLSKSIEMLYLARWNVPKAADYCGLPNREMEKIFSERVRVGKLPLLEWGVPNPIQLHLGL